MFERHGLGRRESGGSKRERARGLMPPGPGGMERGAADPEMLMELGEHGGGIMMQPGRSEKVVHQDVRLRFDGSDLDQKNLD